MTWQDLVVTIILISFSYALIPQIVQGFKEKKGLIRIQTSVVTSIGMYVLTVIYLTLNLYISALIGEITAILWTILFFQKVKYKSRT